MVGAPERHRNWVIRVHKRLLRSLDEDGDVAQSLVENPSDRTSWNAGTEPGAAAVDEDQVNGIVRRHPEVIPSRVARQESRHASRDPVPGEDTPLIVEPATRTRHLVHVAKTSGDEGLRPQCLDDDELARRLRTSERLGDREQGTEITVILRSDDDGMEADAVARLEFHLLFDRRRQLVSRIQQP